MTDTGGAAETPKAKRCQCCNGRGYHRCDCWPGDCICGWGDETCDECEGTGLILPDEYYVDDAEFEARSLAARTSGTGVRE